MSGSTESFDYRIDFFNVITQNINEVFWIRDANGRFVYVGPAYEKKLVPSHGKNSRQPGNIHTQNEALPLYTTDRQNDIINQP